MKGKIIKYAVTLIVVALAALAALKRSTGYTLLIPGHAMGRSEQT